MKFILLLSFISFAQATSAPSCPELSRIVQELETEYMEQSAKHCGGVTTDGLDGAGSVELDTITEFRCRGMAAIEGNIKRLEIEQAVLAGFGKLKADLQAYKNQAGAANQPSAQEAGQKFVDALVTAQSLEALLHAKNKDGGALLPELKKVEPVNRNTVIKMKAAVSGLCGTSSGVDACKNGAFDPNEKAIEEINGLLSHELDGQTVERWKNEMKITKASDQSEYSFQALRQQAQSGLGHIAGGRLQLTREQLAAINNLPDFANASSGSLNDKINLAKAGIKPHLRLETFKFMLEDAQKRQELELQAQTSLSFTSLFAGKDHLSADEQSSCVAAKTDYQKALACAAAMKSNQAKLSGNLHKRRLEEELNAIESSRNYKNSLAASARECVSPEALNKARSDGSLPEACERSFSQDGERISRQLRALTHLQGRIAGENQKITDLRKFAHEKMLANDCFSGKVETDLNCHGEVQIAQEALSLTSATMNISLVLAKPAADAATTDISAHCENPKTRNERLLCAFGSGNDPDDVITTNNAQEYDAPVRAPSGGHNPAREAQLMRLQATLTQMAQILAPRPPQQNPYAYNNFNRPGNATPLAGQIRMGAMQQEMGHQSRYFGMFR
jgi:hypothetical protein